MLMIHLGLSPWMTPIQRSNIQEVTGPLLHRALASTLLERDSKLSNHRVFFLGLTLVTR